jgi:hypothetical protein
MERGYQANVTLGLFRGGRDAAEKLRDEQLSGEAMRLLLDCLLQIAILELRAFPNIPPVYKSGVKYRVRRSPCGEDAWRDPLSCLEERIADCKDLACWRAAELIVRLGIMAKPVFIRQERPGDGPLYHILVEMPDGSYEDPSIILGMTAAG